MSPLHPIRPMNLISLRGKIALVFLLLGLCLGALLAVGVPRLFRKIRPAELYNVVCRQTDAFRADDYPLAYGDVSERFQQKWPLNEFIALARSDYSGISKSVRIELGPIQDHGEEVRLRAYFIDNAGAVTPCEYQLIQEGDSWKIEAARVFPTCPRQGQLPGLRI